MGQDGMESMKLPEDFGLGEFSISSLEEVHADIFVAFAFGLPEHGGFDRNDEPSGFVVVFIWERKSVVWKIDLVFAGQGIAGRKGGLIFFESEVESWSNGRFQADSGAGLGTTEMAKLRSCRGQPLALPCTIIFHWTRLLADWNECIASVGSESSMVSSKASSGLSLIPRRRSSRSEKTTLRSVRMSVP